MKSNANNMGNTSSKQQWQHKKAMQTAEQREKIARIITTM
jgi:hypothetical protein